ncbi:MAG TPA: TRAFs-binding domain-containing protein [Leptolyngbyaceae cyanobacterium]
MALLQALICEHPDNTPMDDITLTSEHFELAELQAEHGHAQWIQALQRLGWQHGMQFDPINQTHPHLKPFKDLPLPVKEEKRQVFLDSLKVLLALGYRLEAQPENIPRVVGKAEATLLGEGQALTSSPTPMPKPDKLTSLMALRRDILKGQQSIPESYCTLGDILLQMGEPLLAYDVLVEGLQQWPSYLRLQQLVALALARSGATMSANQLLLKLVEGGQSDEQTLGLLARTHKDLSLQAKDSDIRHQQLHLSASRYLQAYRHSNSLWTGINAATLMTVMGQIDQARTLALEVRSHGINLLAAEAGKDPYWVLATLGEAELILENWNAAETYYTQAAEVGQGRFGDLCSSYRNGVLLMQHFGADADLLKHWLKIPRVVVFCGHSIDLPGRPVPRFPADLEGQVSAAIRERLQQFRGQVGFASAASGSDILFLETIRELGGEFTVVLPYPQTEFVSDAVQTKEGNWANRFEAVIAQAREVVIASDCKPQNDELTYEYSNRMLHGLAQIRANQLQTELVPLAVWNGQPEDGLGGTASTVTHWQQWSSHVEIIDLKALLQAPQVPIRLHSQPPENSPVSPTPSVPSSSQREIRALLFADVVHYTQLSEDQIVVFMQHFLKAVADLSAHPSHPPLMQNTWGDALYCVFARVQEAGLFALKLCDLMQTIDWSRDNLPSDLNLRISLHAGPVIRNINPLTGQVNYIGTHVNYAARIEPITPPGKVYASQAFAEIAASEGVSEFSCDYVGQMPWAKHYGTFPTYHVHPA